MRFSAYLVFISLWTLVVYSPVCHWVWASDGWLFTWGALDFAGGTVVHINAGVAALVAAVVLGPRKDYARQAFLPHNVPFALLGAGLLWFGWFGFNAGSALGATPAAALAFADDHAGAGGGSGGLDAAGPDAQRQGHGGRRGHWHRGRPGRHHAGGGSRQPDQRDSAGRHRGDSQLLRPGVPRATRLDDSLDVVAAHGVGGTVGALLTGVFSEKAWSGVADGLLFGNPGQLWIQVVAIGATLAYSGVTTFVLLKLVGVLVPLRAEVTDEGLGMDVTQHGEEAYVDGEGAILVLHERDAALPSALASARLEVGHEAGCRHRSLRTAQRRARRTLQGRRAGIDHHARAGARR